MTSAISVKDRLKNLAVASGKSMQELLTAYGLERTVYRLSISDYADQFTLKGGIFFMRYLTESLQGQPEISTFSPEIFQTAGTL